MNSTSDEWARLLAPFDQWNERVILSAFAMFGLPVSYLDVGSGTGAMVNIARKLGIDAYGVDQIERVDSWLFESDLALPYDIGRSFDLVTSFEVAEHLPPDKSLEFVDTISRHVAGSGILIFSAAHPGQAGDGHINLRPATYWRTAFDDRGLHFDYHASIDLAFTWKLTTTPQFWLGENVQVFRR